MEETFNLKKSCEVCGVQIPDSFGNLLCVEHYDALIKEQELKKQQAEEESKDINDKLENVQAFKSGIIDPNYQENPEQPDKDQVLTNIQQFMKTGNFLWHPTKDMYEWIKDQGREYAIKHPQYPKFIWKPKIVDVGCGSGAGSNIMSQEADFVWGIDKNKISINFAKDVFTRNKNNIYYCPQLTFDEFDIMNETRETMKFDFVVAVEIIEHINDYKTFLTKLIEKFDKRNTNEPTIYYISTPNRNNKHIKQDKPMNPYHVREWNQSEFVAVLSEFFNNIEIFNSKGVPVGDKTDHTPILARCSGSKI